MTKKKKKKDEDELEIVEEDFKEEPYFAQADVNAAAKPDEEVGFEITSVVYEFEIPKEWQAWLTNVGMQLERCGAIPGERVHIVKADESYARKKRVPKEWQKEWQ